MPTTVKLAIPVAGATLSDSALLELQRGNTEVSMKVSTDAIGLYGLNSNATDGSGNGRNGAENNITYDTSTQKLGSAAAIFNGSNGDIILPYDFGYADAVSVSFWIYFTSNPASLKVFMSSQNATPNFQVTLEANGTMKLFRGSVYSAASAVLSTSTWHHVVITATRSTNTFAFHIDGSPSTSGSVASATTGNQTNFLLGRYGGGGYYFTGKLDAVAFYNKILSAGEIAVLYNGGAGVEAFAYSTASPTATLATVDSGATGTVWDMSTLSDTDNLASEAGPVLLQYAYGDSTDPTNWSDWQALAQIQAESDPTGRYFRLQTQHGSNGTQDASVQDMSITAVLALSSGGASGRTQIGGKSEIFGG